MLAVMAGPGPWRWAAGAAAAASALVTVASRSAAAGLLLVLAVAAIPVRHRRSARWAVAACAGVFLVALVGTAVLGAAHRPEGGDGALLRSASSVVTERRLDLWHDALTLMRGSPLRGVGPGRFAVESPTALADPDARWAASRVPSAGSGTGHPRPGRGGGAGGVGLRPAGVDGRARTGHGPGGGGGGRGGGPRLRGLRAACPGGPVDGGGAAGDGDRRRGGIWKRRRGARRSTGTRPLRRMEGERGDEAIEGGGSGGVRRAAGWGLLQPGEDGRPRRRGGSPGRPVLPERFEGGVRPGPARPRRRGPSQQGRRSRPGSALGAAHLPDAQARRSLAAGVRPGPGAPDGK